jgi:hypothetical protein
MIDRSRPGGRSHRSDLWIGLFCLLAVCARIPTPERFLLDGDWGHQMAGANQIMAGEHPFIDFKSTYGPLTFYASALAQVLAGQRPIGEMALVITGYVIAYVVLFRLFWSASGRRAVAVVVLILALVLMPRLYKYYIVMGPALTLAASWRYVDTRNRRSLWALAAAVALSGLYRPDLGAAAALAAAVVVAVGARTAPQRIRCLAGLAGAILVCASPWLLCAVVRGGLGRYLHQSSYGAARHAAGMVLPLPGLRLQQSLLSLQSGIVLCFVGFHLLPVLCLIVLAVRRGELSARAQRTKILATVVLAQGLLIKSMVRTPHNHLLQLIPISLVLASWLAGLALSGLRAGGKWQRRGAMTALGLITAFGLLAMVVTLVALGGNGLGANSLAVLQSAGIYGAPRDAVLDHMARLDAHGWGPSALRYVRAHTAPTERLLVIPEPLTNFYYFADRRFAGGQPMVAPGYFSTAEDQREMVQRLSREEVALVIDMPGFELDDLEERKPESFAPILWTYIRHNYERAQAFGPVVIMRPVRRSGH